MDPLTTPNDYTAVVSLVIGLVIPAIVALFTKRSTSPTAKGILHATLSISTGVGAVFQAYQGQPLSKQWAPALVAAFLAWLSGTAFYHSLLKKYAWFGALQGTLIKDAQSTLHLGKTNPITAFVAEVAADTPVAEAPVNDFPLSTDLVGALQEVEQIPAVAEAVHAVEAVVAPAVNPVPVVAAPAVTMQTLPQVDGAVQMQTVPGQV